MASAQLYPVQANPNLVPPYSLKLSDYATTSSEKLLLNLLMTDVNEANLQVRLRLSIEGDRVSLRSTDFVQGATPIRLIGGVPTRLSNLDLRPYFDLRNLQGITPRQYNTPLPDGLYRFCFEVFDFVTGRPLSQKRCIPAYLVLNDPPFLNLPQRGEQIGATDPQNLIFQWTPSHLNATGVQYEFQLRELWDGGIDPQAAFLASPDLYRTTTFATTLHYGPGETTLLEGKTYGWRVRALVGDGISETSVFRNNGYSEIFDFTYTGKCEVPKFILAKSEGTTTETISWQTSPKHLQYQVQYRKPGKKGAVWFEAETTETTKSLFFLEPATTYEFRVGGQCLPDGGYSFSPVNTFTTPSREEAAQYNCGIPPEILITDQDPLESLNPGDKFTAGDFPVKVVEASGGNGTFSGKGVIEVPYLALIKIAVVFDNISINTDGQMTEGTVETDYDADFATGTNSGSVDLSPTIELVGDLVKDFENLFKKREEKLGELQGLQDQLKKGAIDKEEFDKGALGITNEIEKIDAPFNGELRQEVLDSPYATEDEKNKVRELRPTALANSGSLADDDISIIIARDAAMAKRIGEIAREVSQRSAAETVEISTHSVHALTSTLVFISKDGELPILINGKTTSDSERADESYWTAEIVNTIQNSDISNPGGEVHYVDGNRGHNWSGKKGGYATQHDNAIAPSRRAQGGRYAAENDWNSILSKLEKNPETGKIIEKIQVYTHSRGAAFGIGYTEKLLQLIKDNSGEFADPSNVIDFVYNMPPHQSDFLTGPDGVDSYSMDHSRDKLSDNDMENVGASFTSDEKSEGFFGAHSITSFEKDLEAFTSAVSKGNTNQEVIDNFTNIMKKEYSINVTIKQ